jgi:hypothetical protein
LALKAEESAKAFVGQNSTQKPQDLQRSTMIETRPLTTSFPLPEDGAYGKDYADGVSQSGVTRVTGGGDLRTKNSSGRNRSYFCETEGLERDLTLDLDDTW